MSLVAGIGCRAGTGADAILAALDTALAHSGRSRAELCLLATVPERGHEPGLLAAAARLALALDVPAPAALQGAALRCATRSAASLAATGLPCASEAAALAARPGGKLIGPRLALGPATCALVEI